MHYLYGYRRHYVDTPVREGTESTPAALIFAMFLHFELRSAADQGTSDRDWRLQNNYTLHNHWLQVYISKFLEVRVGGHSC